MTEKLQINIKKSGDTTRVYLTGVIDEDAIFNTLLPELSGRVIFNLNGISRINSCGVREWVNFLKTLPVQIELEECSAAVVEQFNMIPSFMENTKVTSFNAPYICDSCNLELETILELKNILDKNNEIHLPAVNCPNCKKEMEFDDIEKEYFSFLENQK
jgi:hypothetical protein